MQNSRQNVLLHANKKTHGLKFLRNKLESFHLTFLFNHKILPMKMGHILMTDSQMVRFQFLILEYHPFPVFEEYGTYE
jgi:hypothetical protein